MSTPDTYYEKVNERVVGHDEDLAALRELSILIDGAPTKDGILLQIFTDTVIGPVFFEIIQRKGNEGFGEGISRHCSSLSNWIRSAGECSMINKAGTSCRARLFFRCGHGRVPGVCHA